MVCTVGGIYGIISAPLAHGQFVVPQAIASDSLSYIDSQRVTKFQHCPGRTYRPLGARSFSLGFYTEQTKWSERKMQAIDIRCEFAKSKLLQLVHGDAVDSPIGDQIEAATELGQFDFDKRVYEVPLMFKDEPILVSAWQDGQQFAKESADYDEAQSEEFHRCWNY